MSKITKIFILGAILVIAGYDVWAIANGGTGASISWTIWEWSSGDCSAGKNAYPMVPLTVGIVVGHLFWQMRKK